MEPKKIALFVAIGILPLLLIANMTGEFDEEPPEPKTAEERRTEMIEEQFDGWDGSHRELKRIVKESMNDPSSFEHVDTRYRDDGSTLSVIMEFRGANAFGGIVKQTVTATANTRTGEITEINM